MKRRLLPILFLALASTAGASTSPAEWRFEVLLNDKPIGFHTFSLRDEGSRQVLETEASFDVKVLFVTAFRYRHENVETWRDGCLASVSARTNSNGKKLEVNGERLADGFALEQNTNGEPLGDCVKTFAYWNPAILDADRLLNTQTGEYENVEVTSQVPDQFTVGDKLIEADRYTLSAKGGDITLWYATDDGRWLGLEAPAKGGRRIRYLPVELPERDDLSVVLARNP